MSSIDFSQFKVLIVEDNDFVRFMVRKHLDSFGFHQNNLMEALDGDEGLRLISVTQPDLIICDINMTPVDGFGFLEGLREMDAPINQLPVIFLTSNADASFVKKALALNVDAYILKPVVPKNLQTKIEKIMTERLSA